MRRYVIYEMDVDKSGDATGPQETPQAGAVQVTACQTNAQIEAIEALTWFKREYSSGECRAFQATIDGQLAAGVWVASKVFDEDELGVRLILNERQAWIFAAMVPKQKRGHGIYSQLLPFVIKEIGQDFPSVLLAVNPDNKPSNWIHQRWSQRNLGKVIAIRLLGISACWVFGQIRKDRTISFAAAKHPIQLTLD